jgi:zinc transport system ATP-binding protein
MEGVSVPRRLDGVSLEVAKGRVHAVVGTNGAGKSTLLECALGLVPFTGRVRVDAAKVGYVPQRFHHAPVLPMTVVEFLAAKRSRRPVCLGVSRTLRAALEAALAQAGLEGFGARSLERLSGGELRRVLLVQALFDAPELVLLDEPEAGLDAKAQEAFEQTLAAQKARGAAILWVSHDAERVRRLADEVTTLAGGRRV